MNFDWKSYVVNQINNHYIPRIKALPQRLRNDGVRHFMDCTSYLWNMNKEERDVIFEKGLSSADISHMDKVSQAFLLTLIRKLKTYDHQIDRENHLLVEYITAYFFYGMSPEDAGVIYERGYLNDDDEAILVKNAFTIGDDYENRFCA